MNVRSEKYRLKLYEKFSEEAKKINLKWAVLHGSEGYPDTIGRDLDIICSNLEETERALKLFEKVSNDMVSTKWIIYPNPIWGRRILAISNNFEVAELHILNRLVSGLISYNINFDTIDYNELFPRDKNSNIFKSIVMPVLGNSSKVRGRLNKDEEYLLPNSVIKGYKKINNGGNVNLIDKLHIYSSYSKGIFDLYNNYMYSIKIKRKKYSSPTTPIVLIEGNDKKFIEKIKEKLEEVFLDFVCGDDMSLKEIRYNQARQRLIYTYKSNIKADLVIEDKNIDICCNKILDSFYQYNINSRKE